MLKQLIDVIFGFGFSVDPSPEAYPYEKANLDTWRDAEEYKLDYVALIYEALEGENIHEYLYVENEFDILAEIRLRSELKEKVRDKVIPKAKVLVVSYTDMPNFDFRYIGQPGSCSTWVWTAYYDRIEKLIESAIDQVKKETEDTTVEKRMARCFHPDGSIRFDNL